MIIDIDFSPTISKSYKIYIDEEKEIEVSGKLAIITNEKVSSLHLEWLKKRIKNDFIIIKIADGEEFKNLETAEFILLELMRHKFDRKSTLIAFGGGIVGDITGFCAAIFLRGVNFIQIPTTLLSQVDASVGGKTGVNTKFGKNLIGAFHQPIAVYCYSHFLTTLPKREVGAGIAEMIKIATTFDEEFVSFLEKSDLNKSEDLQRAIAKSIGLKAKVVKEDEKEAGVRAVLNYGHTFGHVVENKTNYKEFLHGEAVAIGIKMANELAYDLGLLSQDEKERILALLAKNEIDFDFKIEDLESFYEAFFLDKKSHNDKITFVLPKGIGGYELRDNIPKDKVLNSLKKFCK